MEALLWKDLTLLPFSVSLPERHSHRSTPALGSGGRGEELPWQAKAVRQLWCVLEGPASAHPHGGGVTEGAQVASSLWA